ncbi:hypothetical protein GUJ93_ZPchr0007g3434 [Zizania palustris]|uniref:Uncharacterized protein n=1 Tax=Zizania palustris TaxID=103762 RepID=A0A8J5VN00_ZIZPA|nr:hypothetical protein GUJ93_ZPchr0007g3434 [Zizania palustris]
MVASGPCAVRIFWKQQGHSSEAAPDLADEEEQEGGMGRKGWKGKDAAASGAGGSGSGRGSAGGGGGVREATLVRVSKVLDGFRASDAQVITTVAIVSSFTAGPEFGNKRRISFQYCSYGFATHLTVGDVPKERGQESQFCSKYFVSSNTMHMLSNMRKQLQNELVQRGFVPADASACSLNARDPGIIRAVLMARAYPMTHENPLVIYDEITRGDGGIYIKCSSVVGSYPLILLATEMVVAPLDDDDSDEDGGSSEDDAEKDTLGQHKEIVSSPDNSVSVVIDRWLQFDATALDAAQIYCLRERLTAAILFKIKHPPDVLPPDLGATMYAIACILSYDGLPAMVPSGDFATNSGSNQSSTEPSRFCQGRIAAYIPPGDFLMSLLSDRPPNAHHFQKSSNHPGRFDQSRPPQPNNSGPGNSAPRTFKRQRNGRSDCTGGRIMRTLGL